MNMPQRAPQVLARPATRADSAAMSVLERECLVPPWSRATIETVLNDPKYFSIVAVIEDNIVGHAIAWHVGAEGEIDRLAVATNWRRRGLGRFLLNELISIARNRGVRELFLEVNEKNVAAQQLYIKCAFEIVGERRDYYPDGSAALVMKRELHGEN